MYLVATLQVETFMIIENAVFYNMLPRPQENESSVRKSLRRRRLLYLTVSIAYRRPFRKDYQGTTGTSPPGCPRLFL